MDKYHKCEMKSLYYSISGQPKIINKEDQNIGIKANLL